MGRLQGKVAVVTGGVSGIGLSTVERFVEEGAKVVVGDIQDDLGASLQDRLSGNAIYVHTDVTDESAIENLVQSAAREFGKLDVMFNNAGSPGVRDAMIDLDADGLNRTTALLTNSVVFGHKYAARQFIEQGSGGTIISTSSAAGLQGNWSTAAYTIAKHAVVGIVRQAVAEFAPHNIRSNAICPGLTMTPIMAQAFGVPPEDASEFEAFLSERLGKTIPSGRTAFPVDIANAAVYLASDESSYVNGVILPVDGGTTSIIMANFAEQMIQAGEDFNNRKR